RSKRMVKIFGVEEASGRCIMMDVHHEGKQMRTVVGVRYWTRQSAAAPSMRIPVCRESDSARSSSPAPAALGSTAVHASGDREVAGAYAVGGSGLRRQARHYPGLVPAADCSQV